MGGRGPQQGAWSQALRRSGAQAHLRKDGSYELLYFAPPIGADAVHGVGAWEQETDTRRTRRWGAVGGGRLCGWGRGGAGRRKHPNVANKDLLIQANKHRNTILAVLCTCEPAHTREMRKCAYDHKARSALRESVVRACSAQRRHWLGSRPCSLNSGTGPPRSRTGPPAHRSSARRRSLRQGRPRRAAPGSARTHWRRRPETACTLS